MRKTSERADEHLRQIVDALRPYQAKHPKAKIDVHRRSKFTARIRIIDSDFKGKDRVDRYDEIWPFLECLPLDVLNDVTMLLLLTPGEVKKSLANHEFEHPAPWPGEAESTEEKTRRNGRRNARR